MSLFLYIFIYLCVRVCGGGVSFLFLWYMSFIVLSSHVAMIFFFVCFVCLACFLLCHQFSVDVRLSLTLSLSLSVFVCVFGLYGFVIYHCHRLYFCVCFNLFGFLFCVCCCCCCCCFSSYVGEKNEGRRGQEGGEGGMGGYIFFLFLADGMV
ncbi:hypothetical protein TCDM_04361 [Trypanosoma cruzi Dm28c]|uniref:Uncharacterized protein n=1 Tax=Trypanosoma cruzi Dm28c TaxID=1416333 RepID=V5DHW0_TRYCR|nr:hypothetical protein TCDM_04361 [Trypanosoma cruzi Dm28c]